MRYEINSATGEVTEHADAPVLQLPPPTPLQKLQQLDTENALTQRNLREAIMLLATAVTAGNPAVDLTKIPGVAKVFEVEAQAAVLRAQL